MAKHGKMSLDEIEATLNVIGGRERAKQIRAGKLIVVPPDPQDLLVPVGRPITFNAVSRFVAKKQFTEAGIDIVDDNFKKYIFPVVEEDVPTSTVRISELKSDASIARVFTALNVDRCGELSLAHFFWAIQKRLHHELSAYVIGYKIGFDDHETWAVCAIQDSLNTWSVDACRLGEHEGWSKGMRFLSRC